MAKKSRPFVVKIGGNTSGALNTCLNDLVSLQRQGRTPLVVHGGGPTITHWMKQIGIENKFINGLRVTDASSLDVAVAILAGLINKQLVANITALGGKAVGISGVDAAIFQGTMISEELGFVGDIVKVNVDPLLGLINSGYMPLISPIGIQLPGDLSDTCTLLNINGDTAAGHLARSINADALVFLTDVDGVFNSSKHLIDKLTSKEAYSLIKSEVVDGGMIPKLEAGLHAMERVANICIVNGQKPQALINALNGVGSGTWII